MPKTKISIVKYLNAVPLAWGILEGPQKQLFEPILNTPAECAALLKTEMVRWGKVIRDAGIKVQ